MAEDNVPHWQTEEYKAEKREYDRKRYQEKRAETLERQRAWRDANREEYRERCRESMAKHRAKERELNPPPPEPTPLERFQKNYVVDADSGCWLWTGLVTPKGYATMKIHQRGTIMHRWAYEHFIGPIPEGHTIDHLCHTNSVGCKGGNGCQHRRCVNPEHLEPVTPLANTQCGNEHYWANADIRRPTHCPKGHPYVEGNIKYSGKDKQYRSCRTCINENQLRRYHGKSGTDTK